MKPHDARLALPDVDGMGAGLVVGHVLGLGLGLGLGFRLGFGFGGRHGLSLDHLLRKSCFENERAATCLGLRLGKVEDSEVCLGVFRDACEDSVGRWVAPIGVGKKCELEAARHAGYKVTTGCGRIARGLNDRGGSRLRKVKT